MKKILLLLVAVFAAISMFGQERLTIYFADESGTQVGRQVTATLGEAFTAPHLVFEPAVAQRSVRVEYGSTNPDAAEVDMTSGRITLKAAGSTTITATTGQTEQYYSARAQYNLIVEAAQDTTPVVPSTCPEARFMTESGMIVDTMTLAEGDYASIPTLVGNAGSILRMSMKYIDNIRVAELTADDLIWARGEGVTTFTGTIIQGGADGSGQTLQCDYSFVIVVKAAAPQKLDPELSLDVKEISIELGEAVTTPKIINPNNIDLNPSNGKWYNNWNSKVASVNEETGEVTILGVGTDTIYFEFTGNDTYKGTILSYQIHVTTTGLVVGGVTVMNSNCKDILNDGGSITYDPITHTLTMTNAIINGEGLNLAPARIQSAYADELPASGILYTERQTLTIVLIGGNAIVNVEAGVFATQAPVVMMNEKENFGSIRINAGTVAIKAEAYKIFKCYVTAYGGAAGVATARIGVATGANIVADGQVAIQAQEFIKAEDNNGKGIDILTEGVTFEPQKGFMKEGKYATHVEIGQKTIVPTTDEVTTIDFTQTDPDGNETVVFSTSANGDGYNEETEQLEIVTSLTDAQVAEALETIVPGSSAWVSALPGSLTFDIPAGEGEIRVYCQTIPGYSLKLKINGGALATLTQEDLNWAKVTYNVTVATHVVIYLHAESTSAPARMAAMQNEEPAAGAYIKAVKIAPKDAPDPNPTTDIELTDEPSAIGNYKMIRKN